MKPILLTTLVYLGPLAPARRSKEGQPTMARFWLRRCVINHRRNVLAPVIAAVLVVLGHLAAGADIRAVNNDKAPTVKVVSVRRVFHNGEHNAFTDLCRFRGQFWLAFRSCPDGHMVHPRASVIVLRSADGMKWEEAHRFHAERRDTRDPHLIWQNW